MTKGGDSKDCPAGYILRKGYTRKFKNATKKMGFTVRRNHKVFTVRPKANSVHVPAACIKDRGLAGKGPRDGKGIGPLRKGELIKYGYSYRLPDSQRRSALKRAVDRYGALTVYRKLDAVAKLSMRTAPDASKIFKMDRDWIRSNYTF
jgi:Family of unknown function (DUF5771)